jgi:hypothetical protein
MRLLHRFYEPLILLEALGQTRGERDRPEDRLDGRSRRRRLQDNLSSLCDTEKGGQTTSAAAFAKSPNGITLWIASNVVNGGTQKNVSFLKTAFADARHILKLQGDDRTSAETKFTNDAIAHAQRRITKETAELIKAIKGTKNLKGMKEYFSDSATGTSEFW